MADSVVSTKVIVNGRPVALSGMSTADGLTLYAALSPEDKKQADAMAQVVTICASVKEIAESNQLDPTKLIQDWIHLAANSTQAEQLKSQFSQNEQAALSKIDALHIDVKSMASMVTGGDALLATYHTVAGAQAVLGAGLNIAGAAIDGAWNGGPHIWNLMTTMSSEGWHQIVGYGGGAPKDSARAFAATVIYLQNEAASARHAQPLVANPFGEVHSQIGSNPGPYATAGLELLGEWAAQHIPFAEYAVAAFRYLTDWSDKKPSWNQLVATAKAEIVVASQKTPADAARFTQLADAAMLPRERATVEQTLIAAKTVAGLPTAVVAPATLAPHVVTTNSHGVTQEMDNGKVVASSTPSQRVDDALHAVVGDGPLYEQAVRGAVAAATVVTVPLNGAAGVARGLTAHVVAPKVGSTLDKVMQWAHEPVGLGPIPAPGKWSWINLPGKIAVGVGEGVGRTVVGTVNLVANTATLAKKTVLGTASASADVVTGAVKGVADTVTDVTTTVGSRWEWLSRLNGRGVAHVPLIGPVVSGLQTLKNIGEGDGNAFTIHATETAALAKLMLKFGARESIPGIAPIMATAELANAAIHGDGAGMAGSGTELASIGSGAGLGLLAGLAGGPLAPVTVPVGVATGVTIGGIVGLVGNFGVQSWWDSKAHPPKAPQLLSEPATQPAPLTHDELIATLKKQSAVLTQANNQCKADGGKSAAVIHQDGRKLGVVDCNEVAALAQSNGGLPDARLDLLAVPFIGS